MLKVIVRPGTEQLCDQSGEERSEFVEKDALLVQQKDNEGCSAVKKIASDLNTKIEQHSYSIGESSCFRQAMATSPRYDSMQVEFLQLEHAKMLKSLYAEIERLQRRVFELSSAELNLASVERENKME
uniref:CCDC92/74 N-terminal domain-containing protein n=1 Tax=Romanomermis culicivorax TaxID=13658 RepID=A0A915KTI0_ROMCU